jgi:hypothetical protein
MTVGGDGFYARIDPVGTGFSPRYFVGNNSGGMSRCVTNCLAGGAGYASVTGPWSGDTRSFTQPFDLFHGAVPGKSVLRQARRVGAVTSSTGRPASGSRSGAATPA